ncbi:MAG: hypothetical protein RR440_01585 [Erysipelotrichaceae bacterium]
MKKISVLAIVMSLILLTGCSDATADISDGGKTLFTVGGESITRDDLFKPMKANAANTVLEEATKVIVKKEIETTDAMRSAATSELEKAKATTSGTFKEYINGMGFKDEDEYYNKYLLLAQQQQGLYRKYVDENFDKIAKKLHPVKAQIIYTTDKDKAVAALADVIAGKGFVETAKAYGDTTNFNGNVQLIHASSTGIVDVLMNRIKTVKKDNTLIKDLIVDATGNGSYILNVVNTNAKDFKNEAIDAFLALTNTKDDAMAYFLKKYNFAVYDINVYNTIKKNNPAYLVQDQD